ncbi:hypothetical protein M404DRAFT_505514 [Pisolithus tinctorius Marx 270]|uniref:Uncharacterized protein n=1 Tax=Pisolithus tinctorius Marx 270 TaxID=870435 RepID=A0A0C3NYF3_PISTI|nr:hypothetical protein M404DRAFT_505514 [Pisolithus tinctorius Marx 270]
MTDTKGSLFTLLSGTSCQVLDLSRAHPDYIFRSTWDMWSAIDLVRIITRKFRRSVHGAHSMIRFKDWCTGFRIPYEVHTWRPCSPTEQRNGLTTPSSRHRIISFCVIH